MPQDTPFGIPRFTDVARRAMIFANSETHRLRGDVIGDAELLLGIVTENSGLGAGVLRGLGVDLARLRLELEDLTRTCMPNPPSKLPQTNGAKSVIQSAIERFQLANHESGVGSHHLLIGLLSHPELDSAKVLASHGLTLDKVARWLEDWRRSARPGEA